jgi:predicted secreted hydrolase
MSARRLRAALVAFALLLPGGGSFASEAPAATAGAAAPSTAHFASAAAPYAFSWPRDHGAHPDYRTEWWYYTGHVTTSSGRRFGYELTFFRIGLRPGDPQPLPGQSRWRGHELYPAHFALTDERGGTFFHSETFAREALGEGSAAASVLAVRSGNWTLRGEPLRDPALERMTLTASAATPAGRNAIDFVQVPEKPPAIHGRGGVSRKAACASCASHYYSYTRLRTTGTLEFAGQRFAITGLSWMDHEFGSGELEATQAGWDWFSIQLNDRRELMLYVLRQKDGRITPQSSGSLIERDGTVRPLPLGAFRIEASGSWHSPHTGGTYPSGWRVRVAQAGIDVTLVPTVLDQELATASGVSYWEGAVDARDAVHGQNLGVGYVELTGYAGEVSF